jgi:P-type Ca2+ transporter type 2C
MDISDGTPQTGKRDSMAIESAGVAAEWHTLGTEEVLRRLEVEPERGLADAEVEARQAQHGRNELEEGSKRGPLTILFDQFKETMIILLIVAAIISGALGEVKDTIAILVIVLLNALLGFSQEYRAEQAMAALKKLSNPIVKVRRNGAVHKVPSDQLVPGDVVLLEAGDSIPADARLIDAANLRVQEAALTGESTPVDKDVVGTFAPDAAVGDRHNMVFAGTAVTIGRGSAVVVETGMRTQLGHIAHMIQSAEDIKTPLQRRMQRLGVSLVVVALVIVAIVFVLGLLRGEEVGPLILTSVAMAVAVVPEGLPAVVTIALALGAQRMLARRALIRKLPAVETLGSVTTICSDKTGTLTENRMTVVLLDVAGHTQSLEEVLRDDMPVLQAADVLNEDNTDPRQATQALLLAASAMANDAVLQADDKTPGDFETIGDPTEGALVVAAARRGLWKHDLDRIFPRVAEAPFTSERKLMSTVHRVPANEPGTIVNPYLRRLIEAEGAPYIAITKGAPDQLVEIANRVWVDDEFYPLDEQWRERIRESNARLAKDGLRVLGVAVRPLSEAPQPDKVEGIERNVAIVGLIGMIDPPREEVKEAVATCRTAGIRPVMITGDHPLTAARIAADLGISENGRVLTGQELSKMSDSDLDRAVGEVNVFARVSPEHKLRIVNALQRQGQVSAMTGDGVNDAPALRQADIGVAMGITGTDVSKEAADMVLLDDNFATIVNAVAEGRVIYDNVRKFIRYTLTSNMGEIIALLAAPFLGMPIPLTALQILWVNLVTDGLPGLALGVEPAEPNTMKRPPHPVNENIFGRGMAQQILVIGLIMGAVSLGVGYWSWLQDPESRAWVTMVFMTLTLSQMGNALAIRSDRESLFRIGLLSNKALLGAVLLTFVLQLAVTYVPFLQDIFNTQALTLRELGISLAASTVVFVVSEIWKAINRARRAVPLAPGES